MRITIWNLLERAAAPLPLMLGLSFATPAAATDVLPQQVGSYVINSTYDRYNASIAISGTRAYVTYTEWNSNTGLTVGKLLILDITNPREPTYLGTYVTPRPAQGVTVRGDLAYVAAEDAGLIIIDVSNPTAPRRIGGYNTSGQAWQVFLVGDYAYLADGDAGLVVIDVSNPASPRRVGGLDPTGEVWQLFVSGNYAYLANRNPDDLIPEQGALRIVDISNAASPTLVATHPTEGEGFYVFVAGNIAYVGASKELQLFDVSDPFNPVHIGNYGVGQTKGVVSGNRAYLRSPADVGLQVVDVSDPASPRRLGGYRFSGDDLAVAGQYAYLASGAGVVVLDLASPANLPRVGSLDTPGYARDVAISGTRAYVADGTAGMQILDMTDPRQPVWLGNYAMANLAELAAANGNYAYVVETWPIAGPSYGCALHVVDVSAPASPTTVGVYQTSGYFPRGWWVNSRALTVGVTGDYAFLSVPNEVDYGSSGRIEVIDLRTPAEPKLAAVYDLAGTATDFAIHGQHLLVGQSGLRVLDIGDPANLQPVGTSTNLGWISCVAVSGTRAYVTGHAGLKIFDLTDPTQPMLLGGSTNFGSTWRGLAASGNYVYGAAGGSGVEVVDISDPANPALVGGNSAVLAADLVISGDHVFVAGYVEGLQVFDIDLSAAIPLPPLRVVRSGDSLVLTWAATVSGAKLESAATLDPGAVWEDVPTPPVAIGNEQIVTVDIGPGSQFFRLRKP